MSDWRKLIQSIGDIHTTRTLLESGYDPNIQDGNGNTALILSIIDNDIDAVELLLEYKADTNIKNLGGATALQFALDIAWVQNYEIAELLVSQGADPNVVDKYNDTPLMTICQNADEIDPTDLIILLIDNGAHVNKKDDTRDGLTVLSYVVAIGDYELTKLLLEHGADPNIKDALGETVLSVALRSRFMDIVDLLRGHIRSTKIQSSFRGKQTRRKAITQKDKKQKAEQNLLLARMMNTSSTYNENMKFEPNIAQNISEYISQKAYDPDISRRMRTEALENDRIAEYLKTMK